MANLKADLKEENKGVSSKDYFMQLESRMKKNEEQFENHILPYFYYIIRMDGNNFSSLTKMLKQPPNPYDKNFTHAMLYTLHDLVDKYLATTGYTFSDEISLIFKQKCSKEDYEKIKNDQSLLCGKQHLFGGRILKLLTEMTSFCATRFNYYLDKFINLENKNYKPIVLKLVGGHLQNFDGRILVFEKEEEIYHYLFWRSSLCYKNCVFGYGREYYAHEQLMKKNNTNIVQMLLDKNFDFVKNVPLYLKRGTYCKKLTTQKINPEEMRDIDDMKKVETVHQDFSLEMTQEVNKKILELILIDKFMEIKELVCEKIKIIV
jgi:tRNA(His) guanylyltransferase